MRPSDLFLALVTVAVWGTNFVLIQIGLRDVPPLLLCAARFFLVAFPLALVVPPPKTSWKNISIYGLTYFALQFAFLFSGMAHGVSAGMASLVLQIQVFFTMGLSVVLLGERPNRWNLAGALFAFSGIVLVATHTGGDMNLSGLSLLLCASVSFSLGVISTRKMAGVSPLSLVVWGSLFAFFPLAILSWIVDGPQTILQTWSRLSSASVLSIAYIVYLSTLLAFSFWNILLSRNPANVVSPFLLLVPVFGFISSAVFLGESFPIWKWQASALVLFGLALNQLGGRMAAGMSSLIAKRSGRKHTP